MDTDYALLIQNYSQENAFEYLANLKFQLAGPAAPDIDYTLLLQQLRELLKLILVGASKSPEENGDDKGAPTGNYSLNVARLLSKNLTIALSHHPNKSNEIANDLLSYITLDEKGGVPACGQMACIVLVNLVDAYPLQMSSLINFAVSQVYKLLKKAPNADCKLVFLAASLLKVATKSDVDEKSQAKWDKMLLKAVQQHPIVVGENGEVSESTILTVKYYITALKNMLILRLASNYQDLLEFSTSSTSGTKMKPETIMSHQNLYQVSILSSHEKVFLQCLQSRFPEIRSAMVDLMSMLLINFVSTGKHNNIDYLLNLYPLPEHSVWDDSLIIRMNQDMEPIIELKKDKNLLINHDSESIIAANATMLLLQSGCIEAFISYVQLELLQDSDYLSQNITEILDSVLLKFAGMNNPQHIQNQHWVKTLTDWTLVIDFLVSESGSSTHEVLAQYISRQFSLSEEDVKREAENASTGRSRKRESVLFGFKAKKSKAKTTRGKNISLYTNPYQTRLILEILDALYPYGFDFNALEQLKPEDDVKLAAQIENVAESELDEEENVITQAKSCYIKDLLMSLIVNESEHIRNYALDSLLQYVKVKRSESNYLILQLYLSVSTESLLLETSQDGNLGLFNKNISSSSATKLLAYSLALLALIKESDATILQHSTIAKILSFCTQNLKNSSTVGTTFLKNASCWIILTSLVTFYPESEFVKLNSSQFLVFWKNLLTSQFVVGETSEVANSHHLSEVLLNLKLRSLSLMCLLNYILATEHTPELSKQLQFLLVKSHKYLIYLESSMGQIGSVTSFLPQAFNESDYNPNLASNVIFSKHMNSSGVSLENKLISMILYNKKIVLQGFVKLSHSLKSDVNSNLVVFVSKVFSDPKLFSRIPVSEYGKEKLQKSSKSKPPILAHENKELVLLDEAYNYNFGLTSRYQSTQNEPDDACAGLGDVLAEPSLNVANWIDSIELPLEAVASRSINYDPMSLLLVGYDLPPTDLITSIVDLSIELFQRVFSNLTYKIQYSLLEQLRTALSSANTDPLRKKAVMINTSVTMSGVLKNLVDNGTQINEDLALIMIEILKLIENTNCLMISLNSNSCGLAITLLSRTKIEETIAIFVGDIVKHTLPYTRGFLLLSLTKMYNYTHVGFTSIYDVTMQLLKDCHPLMLFYSLRSTSVLFENSLGNQGFLEDLLGQVYKAFLANAFDVSSTDVMFLNFRSNYRLTSEISRMLKVFITSLGPGIRDIHQATKSKLFQLLLSISMGIDCASLLEYQEALSSLMESCKELIVFDSGFMDGFSHWFCELCADIITYNMKVGVGILGPTSVAPEALFPMISSRELARSAYSSLAELTKIGVPTLSKNSLNLAFIMMELNPCPEVENLISLWVDLNMSLRWFSQLTHLFNLSSKKLVGSFLEIHYQQKLLPLLQRLKKANTAVIDFTDEEAQNIVNESNIVDDKNQPINLQFKQMIYDLLIRILATAKKSPELVESLRPKIQEIIRLSFIGTTSTILPIKAKGVALLDKALAIFGHMEDPLYPGVSILEQQQAQVISALIPCFGSESEADVIVQAINVSSKFINLPRIKFYSKQRILKTMIYLLEEISSGKFLKFVFLESMAEYGRKAIQLAILNCWAVLQISLTDSNDKESEFNEILDKYSSLLTSLWILVLKDLSSTKYNQPKSRELELYSNYWLSFAGVLSLILERNHALISEFLKEDEDSFFFVLFCQCAESLIKNQNVYPVLVSVNRLIKSPALIKTLVKEEIFGEVIDILDRLILMLDDYDIKTKVIETVSILFHMVLTLEVGDPDLESRQFELLRVAMLPLFENFPFLRQDFNPDDPSHQLLVKNCTRGSNLLLTRTQMAALVPMICGFTGEAKADLFSCMLYMMSKFYEFDNSSLIGNILPFLKAIAAETRKTGHHGLRQFLDILSSFSTFGPAHDLNTYLITIMICVTHGNVELTEHERHETVEVLMEGLCDSEFASTCVQSIKSLVSCIHPERFTINSMLRAILKKLMVSLAQKDGLLNAKVKFETIFLCTQLGMLDTPEKTTSFLSVIVPILLRYEGDLSDDYLQDKLIVLLRNSPESFKETMNVSLSSKQRASVEAILKFNHGNSQDTRPEPEIELKTFG